MKRFIRTLIIFGFILSSSLFVFGEAFGDSGSFQAEIVRSREYEKAPAAAEHSFTKQFENGHFENLFYSITKTPTNTEDGTALIYCSDCESFIEEPVPKLSADEFIVVPYIESTGNEYLDTGLTMEQSDAVIYDLDMQFVEPRENDWAGTNGFLQFYYDYVGHCNRMQFTIKYNQNGDYQEEIYDNGTCIKSLNWAHWTYQSSKIGFFSLGNYNNGWWANAMYGQRARLYGATVTKNGYVAGCYIPVINSKTGETGVFDVVTKRFIKNAGNGGNFILPDGYESVLEKAPTNSEEGSIVISYPGHKDAIHIPVPAIDCKQFLIVPCIESTGREYIDTGLHISFRDKVTYSLDYQFLSDAPDCWAGGNWLIDFCYNQIGHFNRTNMQIRYNHEGDSAEVLYDNGRIVRIDDPSSHKLECVKIGIFRLGDKNNAWWNTEQYIHRARCFGGQVEIDGKLSAYYLPVINMQTEQAGLYDVVTGKFLGNAGQNGSFILPHDYVRSVEKDPDNPQNTIVQYTCRYCGHSYTVQEYSQGSFPDGFQRLDSISVLERGAYIDTGFVPDCDTSVEIEFSTESLADGDFFLFGAGGDNYTDRAYECYSWRNCIQLNYGENHYFSAASLVNTRYFLKTNRADFLINDVNTNTLVDSGSHESADFSSPNSLALFALHRSTGISASVTGTIYSCIIKDGDVVVRSMIPARRLADNAVGMYDTVCGTFYENAGSGCFLAGSVIPQIETQKLPDDYISLPYIRATGTQYVDTGFRTLTGMTAQYTASFDSSGYIVGSHSEKTPYGRNGAYPDFERGFWELGFGEICPQNTSYERVAGKVYSVEFSTLSGNAYLKVNGNLLLQSFEDQSTSEDPVYLLTNGYTLKTAKSAASATVCRLYNCKIFDSSNLLVRDFVPARRASDGAVGLYDLVTAKFFESDGADAFIDDSQHENIDDYTVLNKITFNGDYQILLPKETIGKFTVNAKSYDGKEVYPVYNNGYRLGPVNHPYLSQAYDFYEMTSFYKDTVLHHYIPVIHNTSLEIGVYDTVENAFYPLRPSFDDAVSPLFFLDSSVYHPEIAEMSANIAGNLEKHYSLFQKQGFELACYYVETEEGGGDIHRVPYSLVKKDYYKDGKCYHLYWLNIMGTTGTDEWTSNFSPGNQPGGFHEGFEKCSDFVLNGINDYIDCDPLHNKIIISGYSRGSAVAGILAAKMMEEGSKFVSENVYAYGIACPNYSNRDKSYRNIFHICNVGDMVTALPLSEWGFRKEGVVINLPVDSSSVDLLNQVLIQYQWETGTDEVGYAGFTEDLSSVLSAIGQFVPESVARNPENSEKMTHLFGALHDGKSMDLIEVVQLLLQLSFNGNISAARNLVEFFITGLEKNDPSHALITYQSWIKIMNDQLESPDQVLDMNVWVGDNKIFYSVQAEFPDPLTVICAQYVGDRQTEIKMLNTNAGCFNMTARKDCTYRIYAVNSGQMPVLQRNDYENSDWN